MHQMYDLSKDLLVESQQALHRAKGGKRCKGVSKVVVKERCGPQGHVDVAITGAGGGGRGRGTPPHYPLIPPSHPSCPTAPLLPPFSRQHSVLDLTVSLVPGRPSSLTPATTQCVKARPAI